MKTKILHIATALTLLGSFGIAPLSANNASQKKQQKPFLIQGKLPHLTMMVKALWDDEDLALTPEQKTKLLKIRKETVSGAQALAKQIFALENKVVKESKEGIVPAQMEADVKKIAQLRAEATMLHLRCIYNTRKILTKDQLYILE